MHCVEFVATENIQREIEMDYDTTLDTADANEWAVKEIQMIYPEFDDIKIVKVSAI